MLFGAGREKRVYAVPPYTSVKSLDFEDHRFAVQQWDQHCELCGSHQSFLDEIILDDAGTRRYVCSDTEYCNDRQARQRQQKRHEPSGRYRRGRPSARRPRTTGEEPPAAAVRARHDAHLGRGAWLPRRELRPARRRSPVRGGRVRLEQSTLLSAVSCQAPLDSGSVWYDTRDQGLIDLSSLSQAPCGCCRAPTGASCASMPATACVCRSAPAPTSPSA